VVDARRMWMREPQLGVQPAAAPVANVGRGEDLRPATPVRPMARSGRWSASRRGDGELADAFRPHDDMPEPPQRFEAYTVAVEIRVFGCGDEDRTDCGQDGVVGMFGVRLCSAMLIVDSPG
jgi:hypothetical protein